MFFDVKRFVAGYVVYIAGYDARGLEYYVIKCIIRENVDLRNVFFTGAFWGGNDKDVYDVSKEIENLWCFASD